jgi:pimeloyl-ACP methyl ester carboxylesterase
MAYRVSGSPGAREPLVLLHALGDESSYWDEVAAELSRSWQVYAVDQRGHGRSDWPGSYSLQLMCDDLLRFLDALSLRRVALIGHSMGGVVAYMLAGQQPERISRLVLEDPAPPWPRPPRTPPDRPDGPLSFDWAATGMTAEANDPPPAWRDGLTSIAAPTLIVAGGPGSHIDQRRLAGMAALIPDCELITIPAGHYVHTAEPAQFTQVVTGFLAPGS